MPAVAVPMSYGASPRRPEAYPRGMFPGTGSETLDLVLEFGIIAAMVVLVVLLIKNFFRDR